MFDPKSPASRRADVEYAAAPGFRALAERLEAAGWTHREVATALLSLAIEHGRQFMCLDRDFDKLGTRANRLAN